MTNYQRKLELCLEEIFSCSICLEKFKEPRSLPCLHTFCRECMQGYTRGKSKGIFSCPVCRASTQLPRGGVEKFPTNFMLSSLEAVLLRQSKDEDNTGSQTRELARHVLSQRNVNSDGIYNKSDIILQDNICFKEDIGSSVCHSPEGKNSDTELDVHPHEVILTEKRSFKLEDVELNGIVSCGQKFVFLDRSTNQILVCDKKGDILHKFGQLGRRDDQRLAAAADIAALGERKVVVTDPATKRCHVFDINEGPFFILRYPETRGVNGIAMNSRNEAIVTDCTNKAVYIHEENEGTIGLKHKHRVRRCVIPNGDQNSTLKLKCPWYVAVNVNDDILVSDTGLSKLTVLDKFGNYRFQYGQNDISPGNNHFRVGRSCCDREGRIFLIDRGNGNIHILSRDGDFIISFPLQGFGNPTLIDINTKGQLILANKAGLVKIFIYTFVS